MAVIELNEESLERLASFYKAYEKDELPEYAVHCFRIGDLTVTAYIAKNGLHKVLFQGENAKLEAKQWGNPIEKEKKPEQPKKIVQHYPQIGSDEVGTGDLFGPICVVAAYVEKKDLKRLKELGIADSKTLDDEKILSLGPLLIKEFPYSSLSLDNQKYNEIHEKGLNMNAIKAKMHNRCLLNLQAKYPDAELEIDQFAPEKTYYKYLKDEENVARIDNFSTKGESVFPSVALASCLARYSFLKKMEAMGEAYGTQFPHGGGSKSTAFLRKFIKKHGLEETSKVAKRNFKNFEDL